jgi:hypothetical protein
VLGYDFPTYVGRTRFQAQPAEDVPRSKFCRCVLVRTACTSTFPVDSISSLFIDFRTKGCQLIEWRIRARHPFRSEWLDKIREAGVRRRAEFYYEQLDALRPLRQEVRRELLAEAQKHDAWKLLRAIRFRSDKAGVTSVYIAFENTEVGC